MEGRGMNVHMCLAELDGVDAVHCTGIDRSAAEYVGYDGALAVYIGDTRISVSWLRRIKLRGVVQVIIRIQEHLHLRKYIYISPPEPSTTEHCRPAVLGAVLE